MNSDAAAPRTPARRIVHAWLARQLAIKAPDALALAVNHEKLKMVLSHARLGTLMASAFAVVLVLSLRDSTLQAWVIDLWLAVKLGTAGVRVGLSLRYQRSAQPADPGWRRLTDTWLLIDGVVWGIAGLLLSSLPVPQTALVSAVMAGVCCIATFGLQHSLRSTAAYVTPILTLTALGLLMRGDEIGSLGCTGLMILLLLLLTTAAGSERRLAEGLRLRLQAQTLSIEKDAALQLAMRESSAKSRFLGHISHELRTPLHGILGVARLLHLEAPDPRLAHHVELIESSGKHLLGLINDLLDVARLESGCFTMRSERFDLASLAYTLADVYAVRADEKGLEFTFDAQLPSPCWVQGDPARVRQVLHNLLGNAIKFTHRGALSLRVARDAQTAQARFEVSDTGPGISADDLALVFDAFRQSAAHEGRPQEGTGLGLFIARDIARAMGGDLVLHSAPGKGTCALFTAELPAGSDTPAAPLPAPAPGQAQDKGSLRVLIAEDDDVNALIATAYLEHLGVQAERVRDGAQAARHALRDLDRPDLVLMDCRMPVMDGLAATREIRAQEQAMGLPRLPIVALTANDLEATREQCSQAGMDAFLGKPFSKEELARILHLAPRHATLTSA